MFAVQKSHQIKGKSLDVKKAISKQDMDRRHDQGRMSNGYGSYGGAGYSKLSNLHASQSFVVLTRIYFHQITGMAAIKTAAVADGIATIMEEVGAVIGTVDTITTGVAIVHGRVRMLAGRIEVIKAG